MSMTPPEMTPDEMQKPPKAGMSTGTKILIALGVLLLVLILSCCGGFIAMVYYFQARMVSQDPAKIAEVTEGMARIDVPDALAPQLSMDMKVPFTDQRMMVMAVYADEATHSTLTLVGVEGELGEQQEDQMQRSIDQQLRQQGMYQEDVQVEESYEKEVEIRGQTATFKITKGVGAESQDPRIQATGAFQGKNGPVMLILNADAEKVSEQQVVEMIDSIE
jgi:hypothetical protein